MLLSQGDGESSFKQVMLSYRIKDTGAVDKGGDGYVSKLASRLEALGYRWESGSIKSPPQASKLMQHLAVIIFSSSVWECICHTAMSTVCLCFYSSAHHTLPRTMWGVKQAVDIPCKWSGSSPVEGQSVIWNSLAMDRIPITIACRSWNFQWKQHFAPPLSTRKGLSVQRLVGINTYDVQRPRRGNLGAQQRE